MESIKIKNVTKEYKMYDSPIDQLKEAFSLRGKKYHNIFYALNDISLEIEKGEIIGIMGRNGAGKSTLLKIITGILEPTSGDVSTIGKISSLLELGAGFNMEYSGLENIYFYGTIMGYSKKEMDSRVDDIIDFAEIGDYVYQPVKTYSSGMFARLAFACAINVNPDILIVDEILSVGDIRFQAKCFQKFKEFQKKNVTILYVGHDINLMRSFCTRCVWMEKGKIVDVGDPAYVSAKYVEYMYIEDIDNLTDYKTLDNTSEERNPQLSASELNEFRNSTLAEKINNNESAGDEKIQSPISHWGTCVGCVKNISIKKDGKAIRNCGPRDFIDVEFDIISTDEIDYKNLSAAISIKNLEGKDLIVFTTYDENVDLNSKKDSMHIAFSFQPRLKNGDYYLVIAIEDRSREIINYYEYIEGAYYFKIYSDKDSFGMFNADVNIQVE